MRSPVIFVLAAVVACASQKPEMAPSASTQPMARSEIVGELLPDEQVQQVLSRLTFGARPGDAAVVRSMGVEKWIDRQLHPERIDDRATEQLMSQYEVLATSTPDLIRNFNVVQKARRVAAAKAGADSADKKAERRQLIAQDGALAGAAMKNRELVGDLQSAKLARAVVSDRQLNEVMVDFWENHFSVYSGKGQTRLFLAQYDRDVIRPRALGKFRDLLGAVAKSPAMLFFLDNWESAADSTRPTLGRRPGTRLARPGVRAAIARRVPPGQSEQVLKRVQQAAKRGLNENYARELMELHTLGVDGGYTQKDVQEVARVLTGWTFNRQTGEFTFNPGIHDAGEKTILGQKFPAGHGQEEGEQVLDLLARAPATAHFITTKLARHFVSDDPPPALVDRCASEFTKTDGDIRETVRCIVTSPEFFSRAAYRAKVKTPFELVASGLRSVGAQADTTPRTAQFVSRLGQPIFGRQTPDGWPDHGDAWMNTGAILNRINFGLTLAAGQIPGARLNGWAQYEAIRSLPRAQQVDSVVKAMLGGQVSSETREILMSGDNPMLANAPNADANDMMVAPRRQLNLKGVAQIVGLALGAPEFQRR